MSTKKLQLLENIFPANGQAGQVLSVDADGNKTWIDMPTTVGVATEEYVDNAIADNAFYKPIPVESITIFGSGTIVYHWANIEEISENISYYFNPKEEVKNLYPNAKFHMLKMYILCDDGSQKVLFQTSSNTRSTFYLIKSYSTKWYLYTGNKEYEFDFTDRSTSSSIITNINYTYLYLQPGSNAEYTPTTDYSPATKKYVDDSITENSIIVDSEISDISENPVQNKIIASALAEKQSIGDYALKSEIPVQSVNGQIGEVALTASDVGALPDTTIIPSIDGLATETYVDTAIAAINFIPNPTTASVGQTIVVKAVDDAGKPIEWEPVDFPTSRQTATDNDIIDALIENDLLCALIDENGNILTDEFDNILV